MNTEKFPEISFIDNTTLEGVVNEMINDYQDKYEEITEDVIELSQSDPYRLILYACAMQVYQTMLYVDNAGKQNFIKYGYGDYLDNLGAWKGVERSQGKAASVHVEFILSAIQPSVVIIPIGTRVTTESGIYFSTDETVEIDVGEISTIVKATCTEIGSNGNDCAIGTINVLVDPIAYMESVSNVDVSYGGEDIESDESLEERIYLAPSSYSCAGADDAYVYWAKTSNTSITDVKVSSDSAATVNVVFLVDGDIPSESEINDLRTYLMNEKIRPLTDNVVVSAPVSVEYSINLSYYINESDRNNASFIQQQVNTAIQNYIEWQKEKIGRDINPSMLHKMICDAGAKRCVIISPEHTILNDNKIATLRSQTITYGGIESD